MRHAYRRPGRPDNLTGADPAFRDATRYDYHLKPASPAVGAGSAPGEDQQFSLLPEFEYVHPACGRPRASGPRIDLGAFGSDPAKPRRNLALPSVASPVASARIA